MLLSSCSTVLLSQLFQWNWWHCGCQPHFTFSLRVPPCGQTGECPLPTECNKCLLCVKHLTCIVLYCTVVNLADHSPLSILPSNFSETNSAIDPSKPRHPRVRWWRWALGWGGPSLPFAVQDSPPVVRPRLESSLGGAGGKVLVVTGGEQDVLPCWFGLHAWSGDKHSVSDNNTHFTV